MLNGGQFFSALGRHVTKAFAQVHAARKLHRQAAYAVFRSPQTFFDTTLTGKIVGTLSLDLDGRELRRDLHDVPGKGVQRP